MKRYLYVKPGFEFVNDSGELVTITGKHFSDFAVTVSEIDDDGEPHEVRSAILTGAEIKNALLHGSDGKRYDHIFWNEEEEDSNQ